MSTSAQMLPLFLKLAGRKVVVVGGGKVALAKLDALEGAAARITVVAPEIGAELVRPGIQLERRIFTPADLDGAWLVIAAAPAEVNREVAKAAEERRIFVNAVDDPASGSAYTGGVFRRDGVTVAISTDGEAPALAGLLREGLEALLPDELHCWVAEARELRRRWRSEGLPIGKRRPQLLEALNRIYQERGAP
jgi:uroporphyrin-III C-methyltransferase/precorrin-2 dehydrogenase/sirohydrochlorin ferrochelatase